MPDRELAVFFAWQSDSPVKTNRTVIRSALNAAASAIEGSTPGLTVRVDEATRGMLGADNVPRSIMEKIEAAAIFVGDVTTVTPVAADAPSRTFPNPNVTFEVGYAAANLGWRRLILLTNLAIAAHDELPFDFDRQRVNGFTAETGSRKEIERLERLLTVAMRAIIDGDPPRRVDERRMDPTEIRRLRDLDAIRRALSTVPITWLDDLIERLPRVLEDGDFSLHYSFLGVVDAGVFHLDDAELDVAVREFRDAWVVAMSYGQHYRDVPGGRHVFSNPFDAALSDDQQKAWDAIQEAAVTMRSALTRMLAIVRARYVEIDLLQTSRVALDAYRRERAELERRYGMAD